MSDFIYKLKDIISYNKFLKLNNKIIKRLKTQRFLAFLILLFGTLLLIYMIKVEDEPGALPLLLIIIGFLWLFFIQYRIKKINSK